MSHSNTRPSDAETTQTVESNQDTDTCPECDGRLQVDQAHGETICSDCGLVVQNDRIDRGPEWREFEDRDSGEKSRVGAPLTNRQHDQGLSTTIDWQDKDAYGKSLSSRQRQKMKRLRTWDERFRTRDSKERTLKHALGEIDRMASALSLPDTIRETASVLFRRSLDEDLLPGRSIESMATACLYTAARQADVPRSLDELAEVSRVDKHEFSRAYRYICRELGLELEPTQPDDYIQRFTSQLDFPHELETRARELLELGREHDVNVGKNPVGLAAASIYAAALYLDEEITQEELAAVTNISEVTIRKRYSDLLEADPNHPR